jgi:hypothetical protein
MVERLRTFAFLAEAFELGNGAAATFLPFGAYTKYPLLLFFQG